MSSDDLKEKLREAKDLSLKFKAQAMQGLIFERYRSLTMISSISFAIVGVLTVLSLGGNLIRNVILAYLSFILLILISLFSLGRYLYVIRDDIKDISKQIEELPNKDWGKVLRAEKPKEDYWPETLYILLIISIVLFVLSLISF